jgi:anti-anti-sigma regulatory factor
MSTDIFYDDGVLSITRMTCPAGLALTGEIDESTYAALVDALHGHTRRGATLHLDLSGLQYCDVAGLRAMVGITGSHGPAGSERLVLHAVPPPLRTALRVLGWDALPGVSMTEGEESP